MSASQSCKNSGCKMTLGWPVTQPKLHGPSAREVGEAREAYDVVAGPSLDHRDDVEQLVGHQVVAYVTKILDTNEAVLTESGRRGSLKEYFILREKSGAATCGA